MYKKYFSEHFIYFTLFTVVSILYIYNGYASLGTNDDWALRGMLVAKGIYGTLMMSYPLSYIVSHLYDFFPSFPWYSTLLALVMAANFYLVAYTIKQTEPYLQKAILLILSLLWMTFLWFNMSITILTVTTMITAIGLTKHNLRLSFLFIFIAFLLRTDIMLIFVPYYLVSYFILRHTITMRKKEFYALILLILFILFSFFIQKQDRIYNEWLSFNKARAAIVDMGIRDVKEGFFSYQENFFIDAGWWKDSELLSTEKVIATTPTFSAILKNNIQKIHLIHFIKSYKFKHWLWLLLAGSLIVIIVNLKSRKPLFVILLVLGAILLLITRDVERVSVPLMMLWMYVIFESLRPYRILNTIFIALFTAIFYYYASGQLGYRYFKEMTQLQQEAHQLIAKSGKICEPSINFPTILTGDFSNLFKANYLFYEENWMQLNDKEILPSGWLSRHEFFYKTHQISDAYTTRKYKTYHDYLIDDKTAFFGSNTLREDPNFNFSILQTYDDLYLKDKPECKHKTVMLSTSEHFGISQIRIECNSTKK